MPGAVISFGGSTSLYIAGELEIARRFGNSFCQYLLKADRCFISEIILLGICPIEYQSTRIHIVQAHFFG